MSAGGWILVLLGCVLAGLFAWGFHFLPKARWQILAVIPVRQQPDGSWVGVNLTWYGFFCALGAMTTVSVALFLAGSGGLEMGFLLVCAGGLVPVVLVASRVINRWVEGHWHGFTVGGGSFVGMVAAPWIILGAARLGLAGEVGDLAVLLMLGALAPAYALGEGVGRLACLSFGCCYGRPVESLPAWFCRPMRWVAVRFEGSLKKAAYAHGYEGVPLVPVQAMTSVVLTLGGLWGIFLFMQGAFRSAMIVPIVVSQLWRVGSEFLRADDRGSGRLSAYQWMALIGGIYWILIGFFWKEEGKALNPDLALGLARVGSPMGWVLMGGIAMAVFLRMGISTVTGARVVLDVRVSEGKSEGNVPAARRAG